MSTSAALRHCSMADITFSCPRLSCVVCRHAAPGPDGVDALRERATDVADAYRLLEQWRPKCIVGVDVDYSVIAPHASAALPWLIDT